MEGGKMINKIDVILQEFYDFKKSIENRFNNIGNDLTEIKNNQKHIINKLDKI